MPQTDHNYSQASFDFIVGVSNRELLRVDEVASRLGVSFDFVYDLVAEGALEMHRRPGQRSIMLITRRSVIAWLSSSAHYNPDDFLATLEDLAAKLAPIQRQELAKRISRPS